MSKRARQQVIVEIVEQGPVTSQEDLQRALRKRGYDAGQATLSRDIHELQLIKTIHGYSLAEGGAVAVAEPPLPSLEHLVREFVTDVRPALNQLVVKTTVGSAQPVAAAFDETAWPEVLGTIAGDDTILLITPDKKAASKLASLIRGLLA
jgi:transcriptional regulator of arginine metabolism